MPRVFVTLKSKLDRRKARNESDIVDRQNFLSRDGKNTMIAGTTKVTGSNVFTDICTWVERYYSIETGRTTPKTLAYTQDGKIWHVDEILSSVSEIQNDLNIGAYPESWVIKSGEQTFTYLVDGLNLWKHDGNSDHTFQKISVTDVNGDSIKPIDNIEHRDRQWLISKEFLFVGANLAFDVFDSADDSAQIVVGSGKGENLALQKIEDTLYIFNTEGIFAVFGDVISAVAPTFEIRLVDDKRIIAGRTARLVENAVVFLADDYNLWSWNGQIVTKLSHDEKIEDFINNKREFLDKAVAHYDQKNNYYMLSVVENAETMPKLEFFWDAIDKRIDFIKGRNVSAYMQSDTTKEEYFAELARSDVRYLVYANRERSFDGVGIEWKLRTGDLMLNNRRNFRIISIYPEVVPEGELTMYFRYLIDGRLSDTNSADIDFNLAGESIILGLIKITNQAQFMGRVKPLINYAKGQTVAFELYGRTSSLDLVVLGFGLDIVSKGEKKNKKVGG